MGRPLKTAKSNTVDTGFNNPAGSGNTYGVVGGNTSLTPPTILCQVKIGANAEAAGYIVRQKGKRKFVVSDGTNTGTCMLANSADTELADNTFTVTATLADTSTVRLAYITNYYGVDFAGNKYILSFNGAAAAPAGSLYPIVDVASA
jgi:hypothetical protein